MLCISGGFVPFVGCAMGGGGGVVRSFLSFLSSSLFLYIYGFEWVNLTCWG